jgi:hypothetical protein
MKYRKKVVFGALGAITMTTIGTVAVACGAVVQRKTINPAKSTYVPTEKKFDYSMFDDIRGNLSSPGAGSYTQY